MTTTSNGGDWTAAQVPLVTVLKSSCYSTESAPLAFSVTGAQKQWEHCSSRFASWLRWQSKDNTRRGNYRKRVRRFRRGIAGKLFPSYLYTVRRP